MTTVTPPLLVVNQLAKHYGASAVFSAVNLQMHAGEVLALLGESGVGKSTLLNCIAGLDRADSGTVRLAGQDVARLPEAAAARRRRDTLGFVFQAFHVLPHLSVADNVALPLLLQGRRDAREVAAQVEEMLTAVGLDGLAARQPRQLSGGQLQRVAIARALIHAPGLILADEPTGNLDPASAERVLDLLTRSCRERGAACLIVTHSHAAAARADRVLRLCANGVVPDDSR